MNYNELQRLASEAYRIELDIEALKKVRDEQPNSNLFTVHCYVRGSERLLSEDMRKLILSHILYLKEVWLVEINRQIGELLLKNP